MGKICRFSLHCLVRVKRPQTLLFAFGQSLYTTDARAGGQSLAVGAVGDYAETMAQKGLKTPILLANRAASPGRNRMRD
jgi:hypothetical protein